MLRVGRANSICHASLFSQFASDEMRLMLDLSLWGGFCDVLNKIGTAAACESRPYRTHVLYRLGLPGSRIKYVALQYQVQVKCLTCYASKYRPSIRPAVRP